MLKKYLTLGLMTCTLGISGLAHAQATPTASSNRQLQVGAGGTFLNTDYGPKNDAAISIYADYDFLRHVGIDANLNFSITSPARVKERTYLIGPRVFIRYGRLLPYIKANAGYGTFSFQDNPQSDGTYFVFGGGGGIDYTLTRKINIRVVDFESQHWNTFHAVNNLTPYTITIGAAYSFR